MLSWRIHKLVAVCYFIKDAYFAIIATNLQDAKVTVLGTVPSLVKTWRSTSCMDGLDWTKLR